MEIERNDIMVSISCITYNHAPYIRQCIDGFLSQKTSFKFEVLIHDDASNDGTSEIIKEYEEKYPDIIKPYIQNENQYSLGKGWVGIKINRERAKGKYIAYCEGDDYWSYDGKLQLQVDFLESNQDVSMCYTDFDMLFEKTGRIQKSVFHTRNSSYPSVYQTASEFVVRKGFVNPPSWVYRKDALDNLKTDLIIDGTYVWFVHLLSTGSVAYIDKVTTTYRFLQDSASHSRDKKNILKRFRDLLDLQINVIDAYNFPAYLKDICKQKYYRDNLLYFIIYDSLDELEEAQRNIKEKKGREKILFFLGKTYIGRRLLMCLYFMNSKLKRYK